MADRVEREIEEILAKLETELPPGPAGGERKPISIASKRKQGPGAAARARSRLGGLPRLSRPTMMFLGAGVMLLGLILSTSIAPLIWLSFAGVVLFVGAFLSSFLGSGSQPASRQRGVYWRDRFIEYEPQQPGPLGRMKRRLRRH
jgi:hypothetical protein